MPFRNTAPMHSPGNRALEKLVEGLCNLSQDVRAVKFVVNRAVWVPHCHVVEAVALFAWFDHKSLEYDPPPSFLFGKVPGIILLRIENPNIFSQRKTRVFLLPFRCFPPPSSGIAGNPKDLLFWRLLGHDNPLGLRHLRFLLGRSSLLGPRVGGLAGRLRLRLARRNLPRWPRYAPPAYLRFDSLLQFPHHFLLLGHLLPVLRREGRSTPELLLPRLKSLLLLVPLHALPLRPPPHLALVTKTKRNKRPNRPSFLPLPLLLHQTLSPPVCLSAAE
mmetsp:Transcript_644/g.1894  ORF Transcript_644/g.1894 Transcript_644/m.1894 type:complete len:275 (+) Transcript_644:2171-2995(+)